MISHEDVQPLKDVCLLHSGDAQLFGHDVPSLACWT